jgi:hypothetical protein
MAGDQAAQAKQQKGEKRRQHGEPVQPRIRLDCSICLHIKFIAS